MPASGKAVQDFARLKALQIGGTKEDPTLSHRPREGYSDGLENITSYMTTVKIGPDLRTTYLRNAPCPNIDANALLFFFLPKFLL